MPRTQLLIFERGWNLKVPRADYRIYFHQSRNWVPGIEFRIRQLFGTFNVGERWRRQDAPDYPGIHRADRSRISGRLHEIELGNSRSQNAKDLENEESYSVVEPPVRIVGTWSSSRRQRVLNLRETNPTTSADAAAPPAPTQAKHEEHGAPEQTNDGR